MTVILKRNTQFCNQSDSNDGDDDDVHSVIFPRQRQRFQKFQLQRKKTKVSVYLNS